MVTKIHGQPKSHDLMTLEKELIAILAGIPMALGVGNHGHAGIIMDPAMYTTLTGGKDFNNPANPGIYPTGLAMNAVAGTRGRAEAEQNELINQFETF
jgi:hypothetical protein